MKPAAAGRCWPAAARTATRGSVVVHGGGEDVGLRMGSRRGRGGRGGPGTPVVAPGREDAVVVVLRPRERLILADVVAGDDEPVVVGGGGRSPDHVARGEVEGGRADGRLRSNRRPGRSGPSCARRPGRARG